MTACRDFLVEIGTEELPPKALQRLASAFADAIASGIDDAGLAHDAVQWFASPRRLAVRVRQLQTTQAERRVEKRGPPVRIAFDDEGKPTKAAEAFASGCGVTVDELDRLKSDKGEWLVYRSVEPGQAATELLPEIVDRALTSLPIPKRMRWGNSDAEFVRPVHWLLMLSGNDVVPATIMGHESGNTSRGHRFMAPEPAVIEQPGDYERVLHDTGRVIVDFAARRDRIVRLATQAAIEAGGNALLEPAVVDEVTALVEWPSPVIGHFDPEFLRLPAEVLISTLQEHQRYFPVRDKDGKLLPAFIAISNIDSHDPAQVVRGNERVVHPRLADAAFFWDKDGEHSLTERRDELRDVVFEKDLGSLYDKSARVADLAHRLAGDWQHLEGFQQSVLQEWVVRSAHLAKADLLTELVGEFPDLQGRIGYYYAMRDGEVPAVAHAIEEHYWPRHAGDRLPESRTGQVLAVADRLDTLAGIFAVGKKPTGNKDPFGLRRAALGLLRILIECELELDLDEYLSHAIELQPVDIDDAPSLQRELFDFITDRLRAYYLDGHCPAFEGKTIDAETFAAIHARRPVSPLDFHKRLLAVDAFLAAPAATSLAQANKRIANILRGTKDTPASAIDPGLFEHDAESRLHDALLALSEQHDRLVQERDYAAILEALAKLREPVDAFFDSVMVMTEDTQRRRNRLALLTQLRNLFLDVADLSLIPVG
ncbi:MAG TPA: glycine--tRNA ligase subunit beta [Chromatiales bacterium]|nr:glycine--tRNA ligase subunit beta [Chromatiales bacterium]